MNPRGQPALAGRNRARPASSRVAPARLPRSCLMGATAASQSLPSTVSSLGSPNAASAAAPVYRPRNPTATALYPIVQHHLETFLAAGSSADPFADAVPGWLEHDFRAYLRCGFLAHGFARARCTDCGAERLVAFSCCQERRTICSSHLAPD
jgi:hypothetical protein